MVGPCPARGVTSVVGATPPEGAEQTSGARRALAYRAKVLRGGCCFFFFSSRRRHTRCLSDWSSDVCSSDLFSRISLFVDLGSPNVASKWTAGGRELRISISIGGRDGHDVAMELLLCLGQALWQKLSPGQLKTYWLLLDSEFLARIGGEIDEDALREKRALSGGRIS